MVIYIGNLSLEVTEDDLGELFSSFGLVLSVKVMNDRYIGSGQLRGYAYVEMDSKSSAEAAIAAMSGTIFKGRAITVVEALPLSERRKSAGQAQHNRRYSAARTRTMKF